MYYFIGRSRFLHKIFHHHKDSPRESEKNLVNYIENSYVELVCVFSLETLFLKRVENHLCVKRYRHRERSCATLFNFFHPICSLTRSDCVQLNGFSFLFFHHSYAYSIKFFFFSSSTLKQYFSFAQRYEVIGCFFLSLPK